MFYSSPYQWHTANRCFLRASACFHRSLCICQGYVIPWSAMPAIDKRAEGLSSNVLSASPGNDDRSSSFRRSHGLRTLLFPSYYWREVSRRPSLHYLGRDHMLSFVSIWPCVTFWGQLAYMALVAVKLITLPGKICQLKHLLRQRAVPVSHFGRLHVSHTHPYCWINHVSSVCEPLWWAPSLGVVFEIFYPCRRINMLLPFLNPN